MSHYLINYIYATLAYQLDRFQSTTQMSHCLINDIDFTLAYQLDGCHNDLSIVQMSHWLINYIDVTMTHQLPTCHTDLSTTQMIVTLAYHLDGCHTYNTSLLTTQVSHCLVNCIDVTSAYLIMYLNIILAYHLHRCHNDSATPKSYWPFNQVDVHRLTICIDVTLAYQVDGCYTDLSTMFNCHNVRFNFSGFFDL